MTFRLASRGKCALLAGAAVALLLGPSAANVLAQKGKDKILFVSNRDDKEKFHIYSMNPDGAGQTRVSKGSGGLQFDAVWSPDRTKIAYGAAAGKDKEDAQASFGVIHVMNADGSNPTRLSKNPPRSIAFGPSWSPDGKRIAYSTMSTPEGDRPILEGVQLFVMDADGKNPKRLGDMLGMFPVWSPDGKQILYTTLAKGTGKDFDPRLHVMNADGSNARQFIKTKAMMGRWSPDGKRLVYMSDPGNDQPDLFVSKADGSEPVQLTKTDDVEIGPEWSADGKKIIFTRVPKRGPPKEANIFAIDADGRNEAQLTRDSGMNFQAGAALFLMPRGSSKAAPKERAK